MNELTKFERAVLEKILDGEYPLLNKLRKQLCSCHVNCREMTGVGFYTYFNVNNAAAADDVKMRLGDVLAEVQGMTHGAGFILYIEHGRLSMLEGYGYDDLWPNTIISFTLRYNSGKQRDWVALRKVLASAEVRDSGRIGTSRQTGLTRGAKGRS